MIKPLTKIALITICAPLAAGLIWKGYMMSGHRSASHEHADHAGSGEVLYQCPMHPQIIQNRPGQCPICHMELQIVKAETEPPAAEAKPLYYRHPMDPKITSPVAAKDDMGMPFIPVYEQGASSGVSGRARVNINMRRQQMIGVKTQRISHQEFTKVIRTSGRVAYDPALFQAQEDYLAAIKSLEEARTSPVLHAAQRAQSLISAIRTRLRVLGLSEANIDALHNERSGDRSLLISDTADFVWLYADIYEQDLAWVQPGASMDIRVPSDPTKQYNGKIVSIDPTIDAMTRTAKARVRVDNSDGILRPGMYLHVTIHARLGERLVVPRHAMLDTGSRKLVYVVTGDHTFAPREVAVGLYGDGVVEITSGLIEGDTIVVSGNFLVDAESQLYGSVGSLAFYSVQEAGESASGREK